MRIWSIVIGLMLVLFPKPALAWWQEDWSYRKQISVDTTPQGANISGPIGRAVVLVRLHGGNFAFTDALENGADLRFVASDDKTPLPYHVEHFDPQLGVATIWVSLPSLAGGEKSDIWMYYGNKNAPAGEDVAGTFDPEYVAVYHFTDAAGQPATDKTANRNNTQNPLAGINDGAIIGRGARFPGDGALIIPAGPSLAVPAGGSFTFSAWVKQDQASPDAAVFARGPLVIGLAAGVPYVASGDARVAGQQPVKPGDWTHLAVTVDGANVAVYVNGIEAAKGPLPVPALDGPISLGAADERSFVGELDEVRISRIARPAALIYADALGQGPGDKLVVFGADEKQGGHGGALGTIVANTPLDAWIVIGILTVMFFIAAWVMWAKAQYLSVAAKANGVFMTRFRRMTGDLMRIDSVDAQERAIMAKAPLYRIYETGMDELDQRRQTLGGGPLSAETIEAMRAGLDAQQVEENEKMDRFMVLLTIAISGGPFIGLLGTVLGVMIVFGAVAAAGDVNVNAIAPGIASALMATVAGLAVAIPALFGYNYLNSRIVTLSNQMQVFVDRLITRLAETQRHAPPPLKVAAE